MITFPSAKNARMNTHEVPGDLITPKEAAQLLHIHQATLYRMISDGRLAAWKRGGTRFFVSRAAVLGIFTPPRNVPEDRLASHQESVERLKGMGWM